MAILIARNVCLRMLLASELARGSNDFQSVAIHIFLWGRDFNFKENNICIINKFDMIEVDIVCVCVCSFFLGGGGWKSSQLPSTLSPRIPLAQKPIPPGSIYDSETVLWV